MSKRDEAKRVRFSLKLLKIKSRDLFQIKSRQKQRFYLVKLIWSGL